METKQESDVKKCSPSKAVRDYLDTVKTHPSKKCRKRLGKIARRMNDDEIFAANCTHYAQKLYDDEIGKFSRLTGYGQCQGRLITLRNEVIICCCKEMACSLALKDMIYFDGKILISGGMVPSSSSGGFVYRISDNETEVLDGCPYCDAPIEDLTDGPAEGADR